MITSTARNSRGQGMALATVVLVLGSLFVMGMTSLMQTSGTANAFVRVVTVRTMIEAGEGAILEAVGKLRASVDAGATTPDCPDDWRSLLMAVLVDPEKRPSNRVIVPSQTIKLFSEQMADLEIQPVRVDLVDASVPASFAKLVTPPFPQGLLEMSASVRPKKSSAPTLTVRQRRIVYATLRGTVPVFTVLSDPLGTELR